MSEPPSDVRSAAAGVLAHNVRRGASVEGGRAVSGTGRPSVPLAYYHLQGLVWVVLGGALLTGVVLYRTGLSDPGAVLAGPFGPLAAMLAAFGLLWPVKAYYRSRYGFRYPARPMARERFGLAVFAAIPIAGAFIVAAIAWVLAEPPVSFWGLVLTACSLLVYWPKRRLAGYWIVPVVLVPALSLLPLFGIGGGNHPYSVLLPIDEVILAVLGVLLVVLGSLDHIRLVRLLGVRRHGFVSRVGRAFCSPS